MIELIPNEWRYRDSETLLPFPWYVKHVVEILDKMDLNDKRVFEYGCGDSTLWFRSKGAFVIAVDSNYDWAEKVGAITACSQFAYISTLPNVVNNEPSNLFDIITIDGDYRDYCLSTAIHYIKKDGFIIIDNFEQEGVEPYWPQTRTLIKDLDLKLEIYKEEGHQFWQTAIVRL